MADGGERVNDDTPPDEITYNMYEVAAILSTTWQTVRARIRDGSLKAFRIGSSRIRIKKSELDAFIRRMSANPPEVRSYDDELADLPGCTNAAQQDQLTRQGQGQAFIPPDLQDPMD